MEDEWDIIYYKAKDGTVPVFEYFLESCPSKLEAYLQSILNSVAVAPPPAFSGGGRWEAMHRNMAGYHAAKAIGPQRRHHRVFCLLEKSVEPDEMERRGLPRPAIAVITGMWKPNAALFSAAEYSAVRKLGDDHMRQFPRRTADENDLIKHLAAIEAKGVAEKQAKMKKPTKRRK